MNRRLVAAGFLVLAGAFAAATPAGAADPAPTPTISAGRGPTEFTLSPEKRAQAVAYARARYGLHFAGFLWSVLVLLGILKWRLGPLFRDRAAKTSRRRFGQAAIFTALLLLTQSALELPTGAYGHHLSRLYGQSVQGWGSWLWDAAKNFLVALVVAIPLVWILYGILRRSPRRWWFYFWLAVLPILVFLIFLSPVVVEPLFFRFEPLAPRQPELARRIEEVTTRAGRHIPQSRMYEMNASTKYNSVNAYVSGLGASKRVVVWDTTIRRATVDQTLYVFGHEMGHYVLAHIPKTIAFLWLLFFVMLAAGAAIVRGLLGHGERWGIRGLDDWASLPVLLLLLTVFSELATPAVAGFVRAQEHDADVFGLEAIHGLVRDPQRTAAEAFQILGEVNLADPDPSPFIRFWLYDHPPLAERLRFAATYDPWSKGESPKYLK